MLTIGILIFGGNPKSAEGNIPKVFPGNKNPKWDPKTFTLRLKNNLANTNRDASGINIGKTD